MKTFSEFINESNKFYDGSLGIEMTKQKDYLTLTFNGKVCNNIVSDIDEKDFVLKEIKYNTRLSLKKLKESEGLLKFLKDNTARG